MTQKIRLWTVDGVSSDISVSKQILENVRQRIKMGTDSDNQIIDLVFGPEVSVKLIEFSSEDFIQIDEDTYKRIKKVIV